MGRPIVNLVTCDTYDTSSPGGRGAHSKVHDSDSVAKVERLLRQVAILVMQSGRKNLNNFNLTPPQFTALLTLINFGEITMGQLCRKMFLAYSTVTDLVNRMEKNGFVRRFRDSKDRRVVRIKVEPPGLAVYETVLGTRQAYLASILGGMNNTERTRLVAALEQLHTLMKP